MAYNPKAVDPSKVVKIEALELPTTYEKGEGDYELRWGNKPKERIYHDVISLDKWLKKEWPDQAANILDRLQNFRKAFLNFSTGEISS